jgi:drug/metabolite transporter (DMT)-like permease
MIFFTVYFLRFEFKLVKILNGRKCMILIIMSVFLLGLTHPVGSVLMKKFNNPLEFAILYLFLRVLFQSVMLKRKNFYSFKSKEILILSGVSGVVGCLLNIFQFKALKTTVPLNHIILLTFMFPVWITIYECWGNKENRSQNVLKVIVALLGMSFVFGGSLNNIDLSADYLYPILCSFLIAFWMLMSREVGKRGLSPFAFGFSYDLISLVGVVFVYYISSEVIPDVSFIASKISSDLLVYSLLIGVVPNILFYKGIKTVPPVSVSVIMLLQPIFPIAVSALTLNQPISFIGVAGLMMVMFANFPFHLLIKPQSGGSLFGFVLKRNLPL